MKYLNLGCGNKYSKSADWLNTDMLPVGEDVVRCNFLNGIPFESNRFELVYHSHVLEHFAKNDGERFIAECFRVLKPGGVIRIALPNLEIIAREYLHNMEKALEGDKKAGDDYDWIMLEMFDQTVRNDPGGAMFQYLQQDNLPNKEYIFKRIGVGANLYLKDAVKPTRNLSDKIKIIQKKPSVLFSKLQDSLFKLLMPSKKYAMYKTGNFRQAGEIHQWMYDRYSLGRLLEKVGFSRVEVRKADTSYIPDWGSYKLDDTTESASLFIEAVK
ncbi:MAG: methyltransferase domain-containing protein [Ferruginibacter sp.]